MPLISRRRLALAAASYAALLAVSFVVRGERARDREAASAAASAVPRGDVPEIIVPTIDHERVLGASVRVAFSEFMPPSDPTGPPVLMIHGSPGHKEDFAKLGPMLADRWRVIAPDLPGFGASTHALPDYSFRAHARYLLAMMDRLGIARAHIVGYSMGGGVALNLIDMAPARVASLTMLSAIGVQEMELTGSYYVNHLVHGVQLGGLLFLREGTPHMGVLDGGMLGVEYARNFYDSDQRPLRGILQRVEVPALVVHGDRDPLVPPDAALEHHRLLPQSELVMLPSNHFMPFAEPALPVAPMRAFFERVERGEGVTRSSANASAIQAASAMFTSRPFPRVRGIAAAVTMMVIAGFSAVFPEWGAVSAGVLLGQLRVGVVLVAAGMLLGAGVRAVIARMMRRLLSGWPASAGRSSPSLSKPGRRWGAARRALWLALVVAASAAGAYATSILR